MGRQRFHVAKGSRRVKDRNCECNGQGAFALESTAYVHTHEQLHSIQKVKTGAENIAEGQKFWQQLRRWRRRCTALQKEGQKNTAADGYWDDRAEAQAG